MKNTNKNSFQPVAEQHYKKSYLLRQVLEQEADEEIMKYAGTEEGSGYAADKEAPNRPT